MYALRSQRYKNMAKEKTATKQHTHERPPIVVVMGHVDHGKTTLLDIIRKTQVASKEHGLITQHIGAYQASIDTKDSTRKITFIDTPGHAAFAAMRARGVTVADIAILVVAADDSVKPQTIEAIHHIKSAGIPMIVAINKVDLPTADVARVKKDLATNEVFVEGYGGDTVVQEISAKTGKGIPDLLEVITLVAQLEELPANPTAPVMAAIIESRLDQGRGAAATLIVQQGTLRVGKDYFVEGKKFRVRNLLSDTGQPMKEAGPATPAEVIGLPGVPQVGSLITEDVTQSSPQGPTTAGPVLMVPALKLTPTNEIPIIVKADVQGSLEAILDEITKIQKNPTEGANIQKLRVALAKAGDIVESDIHFAKATQAICLGFNVKVSAGARAAAQLEEVPYKIYFLIYELLDDIQALCESGMSVTEKKPKGLAEVVALFPTEEKVIAGVKVLEGRLRLGEQVTLLRNDESLGAAKIRSMRHVKQDVKEITKNMEAGIVLDGPIEFQVGDMIQYSP